MRELNFLEINLVSGGVVSGNYGRLTATIDKFGEAALTGAILGVASDIKIAKGIGMAKGSVAGVGVALAWEGGQRIGKALNEHTPIQDWISTGIDKITGLDKAPTNTVQKSLEVVDDPRHKWNREGSR